MTNCSNCGTPLDECNESQPVCPGCGEVIGWEYDADIELSDKSLSESIDVKSYAAQGRDLPRDIRLRGELRTVCLQCGSNATGRTFLTCGNPLCGAMWRVNRCRLCKEPVDSRDPGTPRCAKCGWLICASCRACNCSS